MKPPPTAQEVVAAAAAAALGRPIVQNNLRALLVEAMIDATLPSTWAWVAADWAGWDFRRGDGVRLEVKQSAMRQTWVSKQPSRGLFDIRDRMGYFVGDEWVAKPGRNAEVYVFAHHPGLDDSTDHRDPLQWRFYVVPAPALPPTKTISMASVRRLAHGVGIQEAGQQIEAVANAVAEDRQCMA